MNANKLGQGNFTLSIQNGVTEIEATITLSAPFYLPTSTVSLSLQAAENDGNSQPLYLHSFNITPSFNFTYASYFSAGTAFAGSTADYNNGTMNNQGLTLCFALPATTNLAEMVKTLSGQIDLQLDLPSSATQTIAILNGNGLALNPLHFFNLHEVNLSQGRDLDQNIPYLTVSSTSARETFPLANLSAYFTIYPSQ